MFSIFFSRCVSLCMCVSVLVIGMCLHVNPMIPDIHFLHMVCLIVTALGLVCMCFRMCFLYFSHCVRVFVSVGLCERLVCVCMLNPMIPDIHFLHMVYLLGTALGLVCRCFQYFSHCVCLSIYVCLCKRFVCVCIWYVF